METIPITADLEKNEVKFADAGISEFVRELSALDLALVGGGAASNSFI